MNGTLPQIELSACRAFERLMENRTAGWEQAYTADYEIDGGELCSSAWGRFWTDNEEQCAALIADRFHLPSADYVMSMMDEYDYREMDQYVRAGQAAYQIWGAIDDEYTAQLVDTCFTRREAAKRVDELNNNPRNHPDLYYWYVRN